MKYNQFDKLFGRKTEENVIRLLEDNPMTCDELSELIGLDRTSIHYQLKKLELNGTVEGKGFGKIIFYGLKQKFRKSLNSELSVGSKPADNETKNNSGQA